MHWREATCAPVAGLSRQEAQDDVRVAPAAGASPHSCAVRRHERYTLRAQRERREEEHDSEAEQSTPDAPKEAGRFCKAATS